ncbi:magnesium transporter CorA [Pusillimonas sp. TS35]|uniref:magnesium transporter CorA family protein n=1 Tax=Paracandidimonas lactea TaxID=2895524 RepID=UPI001369B322|nr:magnesium transporter CorA family protein [Paracandidimonas lactea]MYN14512.1 magnesium transporter CorA [Pusillimonas sp. TS35]
MSRTRVFLIEADTALRVLDDIPAQIGDGAFVWLVCTRTYLAENVNALQDQVHALTGRRLLDLHISDLLNNNLPSHFDFTSNYDQLVFRGLADEERESGRSSETAVRTAGKPARPGPAGKVPSAKVQTTPVGFVVFDQLLLTVHTEDFSVIDAYEERLKRLEEEVPLRGNGKGVAYGAVRLPGSPAELMLHMISMMVDGYLDLRRVMSRRLDHWQQKLLRPDSRFDDWSGLLKARQALHHLYDLCEDQRNALTQWMDMLAEWPVGQSEAARYAHELLLVRSRDIQEHIERVSRHIRELENSAETAVQIHFNIQSNRTNDVMRTLTAITAIFLPLNLIAGIFGMNFEFIPGLRTVSGFWWSLGMMALIAFALLLYFARKRYLTSSDGG